MPGRKSHDTTTAHVDAERLVTYLISEDGSSAETNDAIAARLGISHDRFKTARRHASTCGSLGGFMVAYRKRGHALVLTDPTAATILKVLVADRTDPMMAAWHDLRAAYLGTQRRMVAIVDSASKEALSRGDTPVSDALSYAARDIERHGEVQPSTQALLAALGIVP